MVSTQGDSYGTLATELNQVAPAGIFRGEARSTKGGLVRESLRGGFRGAEPPGRRRSFQKFCKKSMKSLEFKKNGKKISRFEQFF